MEQRKDQKDNMQELVRKDMTPAELIRFMEQGAVYKSFPQILESICPSSELSADLIDGLASILKEDRDSISRKVRKWLKGENLPQNREQLFQICFALGFGEAEANRLLANVQEMGIHYRNPKELVYTYCLRSKKTYGEANRLSEQMLAVYEAFKTVPAHTDGIQILRYTSQLRMAFQFVETEEDLEAFFRTNSISLGTIHEAAYVKFMELLRYLQKPEAEGEGYSMEYVMEQYLRMNIPNTKQTGGMTYLQKAVKKNWPSERLLLQMKNRKRDISRKVLLLLFIVTEDFETSRTREEEERLRRKGMEDFDEMEDLMEEDTNTRLEVRLTRINLFLDSYGMNRLDPESPFDCLILYALKAGYDEAGDVPLGTELQKALAELFPAENEEKKLTE